MISKFRSEESGAVLVVEMTMIFPIVLLVMTFLIYLTSYTLQGIMIDSYARKIAVTATRFAAMPGYEKLYYGADGTGGRIPKDTDFSDTTGAEPSLDLVNAIMREHDPYRYFGNSFLSGGEISNLVSDLENLINTGSFLNVASVDVSVSTQNYVLTQRVVVEVTQTIEMPGFMRAFGLQDSLTNTVSVYATIGDAPDFIRTTDMVFDMTQFLLDNLKIGGVSISEKISTFKQKISDAFSSLGLSWGN
ncbi:MAG: hypothetical protein IK125_07430 [Lachnospiraceae bacterium]|nr:hypothetical protein [Lachnospiraceae bacterium]